MHGPRIHRGLVNIEPGYLDPTDRDAEIVLQHLDGTKGTDILSREQLPVHAGRMHLRISTATLRIVDIEHR